MSATGRIVIVGAGHGGVQAAASLRDEGYEGPIALVSDDPNAPYQRPPFPATWARMQQKGRVFYTSMGHREDVWENPLYQGLLTGAIHWALKKVDANVEPNITKVTPGYNKIPS